VPLGARLAAKHVLPSLTLAAAVTALCEMVLQRLTSTGDCQTQRKSHEPAADARHQGDTV